MYISVCTNVPDCWCKYCKGKGKGGGIYIAPVLRYSQALWHFTRRSLDLYSHSNFISIFLNSLGNIHPLLPCGAMAVTYDTMPFHPHSYPFGRWVNGWPYKPSDRGRVSNPRPLDYKSKTLPLGHQGRHNTSTGFWFCMVHSELCQSAANGNHCKVTRVFRVNS